MKKYIIAPASTQSEWDSAEFALIGIDDSFIKRLKDAHLKLEELKPIGINELTIYGDMVDFFSDIDDLPERIGINNIDDIDHQIIELTDEEFEALIRPEQTIKYGEYRIAEYGIIFSASGKNTGEEYWCEIPYEFI